MNIQIWGIFWILRSKLREKNGNNSKKEVKMTFH